MTSIQPELAGRGIEPPVTLPAPRGTPAPPPARGLASNISALATSQAITWSMTLLWAIVVPRLIGPAALGLLVGATAVTAIFGVLLGLPTRDFLTREMVAKPAAAPRVLGTALLLRLCFVPVFLAGVALYAATASLSSTGTAVLYLCTGATLCTLLMEPLLSAFQATERMQYLAYNEVLSKTLQSVGGIALALLGVGVVGLTWFGLGISALLLALCTLWARRLVRFEVRFELARLTSLARASAPYWTFGVFFMFYLWIDSVLLALMAPAEVVGWYGVATRLFTTMMFLPVVLSTAWLPRLVAAFHEGEHALYAAARRPVEVALVISLPLSAAVTLTARDGISLLYGDEFAGASTPLAVLALCLPPMYLSIMLSQVLVAAGRPKAWACLMAAATVVNPAVNLVLVRSAESRWDNGAIGAALSLLVTEVLIVAGGMAIVGRHVVNRATVGRVSRSLLAVLVMAVAMTFVLGLPLAAPLRLVGALLLGAGVFTASAVALRVVTAHEIDVARSTFRQMARRRRGHREKGRLA